MSDRAWQKIFDDYHVQQHNFTQSYYLLSADQIKFACQNFTRTSDKEPRILCKQDRREDRPLVFRERNLFILPISNGHYAICQGEGYVDIPDITSPIQNYTKQLDFELKSSQVGDSEMQYLDFAYANSLIRTFMADPSLVLTIRGRKYTPFFAFQVNKIHLEVQSVQTEVDAGYEGQKSIVLVEAKNSAATNTIIRQLYYPYRQWHEATGKTVYTLFFEKRMINDEKIYYIWQYAFDNPNDYNSIRLVKSSRYRIL